VTAVKLDIANPDTTLAGSPTIVYDANGNRTSFSPYGTTDTYVINNLNQYATRNSRNANYDNNGNMTTGFDGSGYTYDAQNRLISVTKNGRTETFKYDALNRVVARTVNGATAYSVWDGWSVILNCDSGGYWLNAYTHGPDGVLTEWNTTTGTVQYCYHDGSGSTSHIADGTTGQLLEWYRFDLQGTPLFYNAANSQIPRSNYDIRHLFTGQQWYSELGLYDLRNRFYSPDIGRFLQADPDGFNGDSTNLYRYSGNNPLKWSDPSGLGTGTNPTYWDGRGYSPLEESERVIVTGEFLDFNNYYNDNDNLATSELLTFGSLGGEGSLLRFLLREQSDFNIGDRLPPSSLVNPKVPPNPTLPATDPYANNNTTPVPSPSPTQTPPGLSGQTMQKIGTYMVVGGVFLTFTGGVMQFTPAAPAGWVIGGLGVVIGVSGGVVWVEGYLVNAAGAEGY